MSYLIGILMAVAASSVLPGEEVCNFTVSGTKTRPEAVGPPEIAERVVFLTQPDSPVEIVYADFSDAMLDVGSDRFQFSDGHRFEIRNRSDRSLYRVEVVGLVGGPSSAIGAGGVWEGVLPPGRSAVLVVPGGYGEGNAPEEEVTILVAVESVHFEDCAYWPSKSIPLAIEPGKKALH